MTTNPWYKRSIFGSLLYALGVMGVYWIVDGKVPTSSEWITVLGMALGVFGYTMARPTGPVPK